MAPVSSRSASSAGATYRRSGLASPTSSGLTARSFAAVTPASSPGRTCCSTAAATRARSERERHGVLGLVNLFGIESPGLTRGLALAMQTDEMGDLQTYENNAGG
ncbi:hypothetical protein EMIT0P12_20197 [Pseudomonas sp. IT-P12]